MSARNSRTSRGARVRWAAVGALVLLAAPRAHAEWRQVSATTQTLNSVLDVWGHGKFSVGFEKGAYLFLDDSLSREIGGGTTDESVGTHYVAGTADCFVSINSLGARQSKGANGLSCGAINPSTSRFLDELSNVQRVKHARGGGAAITSAGNSQNCTVYLVDSGIDAAKGVLLDAKGFEQDSLSFGVTRVDNQVRSVVSLSRSTPAGAWYGKGWYESWSWRSDDTTAGSIQAVELFPTPSSEYPYAVVGALHVILQGAPNVNKKDFLGEVYRLDSGKELLALAMNVEDGSGLGHGFGMALVWDKVAQRMQLLRSVPMASPEKAGTVWKPQELPAFIASVSNLEQLACHGAAYCVLSAPKASPHNLFTYSNDARPVVSALVPGKPEPVPGTEAQPVEVPEGRLTQILVQGTDTDGDPVRLTVEPHVRSGTGWSVNLKPGDAGEPVAVEIAASSLCVPRHELTFDVTASDGLAANDVRRSLRVNVVHDVPPTISRVVREDGSPVSLDGQRAGDLRAGGGGLTLEAVGDKTPAGCQLVGKSWSLVPPAGMDPRQLPSLRQEGSTAFITPPALLCEAAGRDFPFKLEVRDEGGLSKEYVLPVHVAPWGPPRPAFDPARSDWTAAAGVPLEIKPEQSAHGCLELSSPGFPGVETRWQVSLADGRVPGPEISLRTLEDVPVPPGAQSVAPGLLLKTPACMPSRELVIKSWNTLKDASNAETFSQRQVRIQSVWKALTPEMLEVSMDEGAQVMRLKLTDPSLVDCLVERELRAELRLTPLDTDGPVRTATLPLPGEWPLPRELSCGRYQLGASLFDAEGHTQEQVREVVLPGPGVALDPRPRNNMKAVCGERASVPLATLASPTAGFCQTPDYAWRHTSGPELEELTTPEGEVRLVTRSQEFDALIGETVHIDVTATKGPARAQASLQVPITVDPFVKVERSTDSPAASEMDLVGVLVHLTNTSECDVSGVLYEETLEGMSIVEGSVKLDGEPVLALSPKSSGTALQVEVPHLAGRATRTLSYVARPHLVGERRMWGEARKKGTLLSEARPDEPPPVSGCGCASASSGPMLLVLAAVGGLLRRRRPTTRS
ncbi:MAG: hypothetical protein ABW123_05120 [Cystobacter sp.]